MAVAFCASDRSAEKPAHLALRRGAYSLGSLALSIARLSQAMPSRRSLAHLSGVSRNEPLAAFCAAGSGGRPIRACSSISCFVMD